MVDYSDIAIYNVLANAGEEVSDADSCYDFTAMLTQSVVFTIVPNQCCMYI